MEPDSTVAVAPAEPSPGNATPSGQAAVSTPGPASSQAAPATPSEQTPGQGGTPKALWNDLTSAERDYKALQAEYTKTKQAMAKLGDLSQAEQRLALMGQLSQDPEFVSWAKGRLAKSEAGSDDPETQKALEIVDQVAARRVQEAIAPLMAQAQSARLAAVLQAMDRKHEGWRDHADQMRDGLVAGIQAGIFPKSIVHNLSLDFLEKLYAMHIGLDPAVQAKAYAKDLARKQAASTQSTPGTAPAATAHAPVKSVHEALALARKQLG
jgi:hypothetical protein